MFELSLIILTVISLLIAMVSTKTVNQNVSVVIPAFNEEKTIKHVINTVKQVRCITEIIVVDDGSTDKTYDISSNENITVLQHKKNKGKGSAMKTGLKQATGDIILFLDADLPKINKLQVEAIIKPLLDGVADITKTKFKREAGRVTELTAKPLLQFFFPELSFEQPLSGQFAAFKSFLDKIDLEKDYGVDIGIVLDADARGMRIIEVDIGDIVHEMSTLQELNIMANEVVRTIVDRAISYGRLTMMDDLGNAIRMELLGLSLITFGIFGLFFIQFMNIVFSMLFIIIGIIISLYYLYKLIKMSIRIYRQKKVPTKQLLKSFLNMQFSVVISVILLLVLVVSLLGSVSISSGDISLEPVSRNLVISSSPSSSGVSVRGPYTVESALENEELLIRLSDSALSTLQAQYGDYIYINGTTYQLEQALSDEVGLIRVPSSARDELNLELQEVIRDSDLRGIFENVSFIKNIEYNETPRTDIPSDLLTNYTDDNMSDISMGVGTTIGTEPHEEKILSVEINGTVVGQCAGIINNSTYTVYMNGYRLSSLELNESSTGEIYNGTYDNSSIKIILTDTEVNTTTYFADNNADVKFLNIHL